MEDQGIVALYWERDEAAIRETEQKYGRYLTKIAYSILADQEDSEETVNDTYLKTWNSIPPHRPQVLSAYLGKITRETAIDRYRRRTSAKRIPSEYTTSLEELEEVVPGGNAAEELAEAGQLAKVISDWLRQQNAEVRSIFICRYFYTDSIKEMAAAWGMAEDKVKSILRRARKELREVLIREGYSL